jgi:hypothetical protein
VIGLVGSGALGRAGCAGGAGRSRRGRFSVGRLRPGLPHVVRPPVLGIQLGWVSGSIRERSPPRQGSGHGGRPRDDRDLVRRLRGRGYDAAVIVTSFSQSPWPVAYLCRLAEVPLRIGMSKEFGGAGLTHWVPAPPDEMYQVDRSLHLLGRVGVPPEEARLSLVVPDVPAPLHAHRGVARTDAVLTVPPAALPLLAGLSRRPTPGGGRARRAARRSFRVGSDVIDGAPAGQRDVRRSISPWSRSLNSCA